MLPRIQSLCPPISAAYTHPGKQRHVGHIHSWFSPCARHLFVQRKTRFACMELCGKKRNWPVETKVSGLSILTACRQIFRRVFTKMHSNSVKFSRAIFVDSHMTKLVNPNQRDYLNVLAATDLQGRHNNWEKHILTSFRISVGPCFHQGSKNQAPVHW
jgi:hypothetical protein